MSDKPVAERLQVKGTRTLALIGADPSADKAIGAQSARTAPKTADVVVLFLRDCAAFEKDVAKTRDAIRTDSIFWLAYPKLTSALAGDLSRDVIHKRSPALGLDTIAQIAIDDTWSAMRLNRL
jgi:hypothetical protein